MQRTVDTLHFQSDKMDLQLTLLDTLAVYVGRIDEKLGQLNSLIGRAQQEAKLSCSCGPIIDKLAALPEIVSTLIEGLPKGPYATDQYINPRETANLEPLKGKVITVNNTDKTVLAPPAGH